VSGSIYGERRSKCFGAEIALLVAAGCGEDGGGGGGGGEGELLAGYADAAGAGAEEALVWTQVKVVGRGMRLTARG